MSPATGAANSSLRRKSPAFLVILAGLAFAVVELRHMQAMSSPLGVVLEATLPFVGALALASLGYVLWSGRYGYEPAHVPRVVAWVAIGMVVMVIVFLWLAAHQAIRGAPFHHAHFLVVNNLVVGGLAGFLIGTYDVRSKASQRRVERERGKMQFVEHVLRHHILNGMNVVLGQAERLANGGSGGGVGDGDGIDDEEAVELIKSHGEEIVDRVEHVRTIGDSFAEDPDAGHSERDLSAVARGAVERARERYPTATFEGAIEEGVSVRADENCSLVVDNLVSNAVEHNDRERARVEVSVTAVDDRAVLRVADGGPGISEAERAALEKWEAGADVVGGIGVGLAIVKVLVDRYDGSVDVRALEGGGTEAVVELPLAS